MKKTDTLFIFFILFTTLFGLIPNTFMNYGWNYYQFLNPIWFLFPVLLGTSLYFVNKTNISNNINVNFCYLIALLFSILFFVCRTKIHAFGGDVNFAPMLSSEFTLNDYPQRAFHYHLNIEYPVWFFLEKICNNLGVFKYSDLIPSVLTTSIEAILFGIVFMFMCAHYLKTRLDLFFIVCSAPFIFNFFGNTDSYAFVLCMAFMFFILMKNIYDKEIVEFKDLFVIGLIWVVFSIAHPIHIFGGFALSYCFTKYLKQFKRFEKLPDMLLTFLFALVFFLTTKYSENVGNPWFIQTDNKSPIFSKDVLIHYVNMILLPSLPLLFGISTLSKKEFKQNIQMFLCASSVFFAMGFALGADDQFNYQFLLFYFLMPMLFTLSKHKIDFKKICGIVACQLSLLIPMIAVHTTYATMKRADYLYPIDTSGHNKTMSWQTHLGLIYADNFQNDKILHAKILSTFKNGSMQSNGFNLGNYIYHTAFLYQYGYFTLGKTQLWQLLSKYPNVINQFISIRPAFIVCNRKILWNDIEEFLEKINSPDLETFKLIKIQLENAIKEHPYYDHLPSWAITE